MEGVPTLRYVLIYMYARKARTQFCDPPFLRVLLIYMYAREARVWGGPSADEVYMLIYMYARKARGRRIHNLSAMSC